MDWQGMIRSNSLRLRWSVLVPLHPTLLVWIYLCGLLTPFGPILFADDTAQYPGQFFDGPKEYPNFFLPEEYQSADPSAVPAAIVDQAHALLSRAMQSILRRTTVPVLVQDGGGRKLRNVRIFDHLNREARAIDSNAELLPSAGVLRAALGSIYYTIKDRKRIDPKVSSETVLEEIASSSTDIPGFEIRGVGSDFDVVGRNISPALNQSVQARVRDILNSAEESSGARDIQHDLKKTFYTFADVKDLDFQLNLSAYQGGSTVDLLAFDVQRGEFVHPSGHPQLSQDIARGYFEYLAPTPLESISDPRIRLEAEKKRDFAKQVVRGMRTLIETPWLRLKDESQFRKELVQARVPGANLDRALQQFEKLGNNARNSAASNRFLRGAAGSLESEVRQTVLAMEQQSKKRPLIKEFVPSRDLENRPPLPSNFPTEVLMPVPEFIEKFTDNGVVYHGTPSGEGALAILRGGLWLSGGIQKQGGFSEGSGGYAAPERRMAKDGASFLVLTLPVRRDPRLRIVRLQSIVGHRFFLSDQSEAPRLGLDLNAYLAAKYDLDWIIPAYIPLLQNMRAIETEKIQLRDILISLGNKLKEPIADLTPERMSELKAYRSYYQYAVAGGLPEADQTNLVDPFFIETHYKRIASRLLLTEIPPHQLTTEGWPFLSLNWNLDLPEDSATMTSVKERCISYISTQHPAVNEFRQAVSFLDALPWAHGDSADVSRLVAIRKQAMKFVLRSDGRDFSDRIKVFSSLPKVGSDTDRKKDMLRIKNKALQLSRNLASAREVIDGLHLLPWDLHDAGDVRVIREILEMTAQTKEEIQKENEALREEIFKAQPALRENQNSNYFEEFIRDPRLKTRYQDGWARYHVREAADRLTSHLEGLDLPRMVELFPERIKGQMWSGAIVNRRGGPHFKIFEIW